LFNEWHDQDKAPVETALRNEKDAESESRAKKMENGEVDEPLEGERT